MRPVDTANIDLKSKRLRVVVSHEMSEQLAEYCRQQGISKNGAICKALNVLMHVPRGRPTKYEINLSDADRSKLRHIIANEEPTSKRVTYAKALLAFDSSMGSCMSLAAAMKEFHVSRPVFVKLKAAYCKGGVDVALGKRLDFAHKITEDIEADIIALARLKPPKGRPRWTCKLLAEKAIEFGYVESISHVAVGALLKRANIKL